MDDLNKFFRTGKIYYNMLRNILVWQKLAIKVSYIQQKRKGNMQVTLTKTNKLLNSMFN